MSLQPLSISIAKPIVESSEISSELGGVVTAIADRVTRAFQSQRRGEVHSAMELFLSILQEEPDNVNALHLLGLIYLDSKRLAKADELFSKALAIRPDVAEIHNNRGICRLNQDRLAEAEVDLLEAIRLKPEYAEAFDNLGVTTRRLGRLAEAEAAHIRAIKLRPNYAAAYCNLAVTVLKHGRPDRSESMSRRALSLQPEYADAETVLGLALEQQGRFEEAEASFRRALAIRPDVEASIGLGRLLREAGRASDAEDWHRRALRLSPDSREGMRELGFTLLELGKLKEAERIARNILEAGSDSAEDLQLFGEVSRDLGDLRTAESSFLRALGVNRELAEVHCSLAELHLLTGRWKTGWAGLKWRWKRHQSSSLPTEQAMWDGSPLNGKTILLWAGADLAEAILFVRFSPQVKARGGRVLLRGPASLTALFRSEHLQAELAVTEEQPLPQFDAHAPLSSLPRILGVNPDTVPSEASYFSQLELDAASWKFWQDRLESYPGQRVGLLWHSDLRPVAPLSFPPACCSMLGSIRGVSLIGLQKGIRSSELPESVRELGIAFDDSGFMDFAAIVAGLDLLICCDSTAAHLAGALGIPVWLALPHTPQWCWLLEREDSPWYPTMRLFRQPSPGDWNSVFARMAEELEVWVEHRSSGSAARQRRQQNDFDLTGGIFLGPI